MSEYRIVQYPEMADCIALTEICFHGERFRQQIPKAYANGNEMRAIHFAAFEDDTPVGLVAVLVNGMYVGREHLKYGFVGSVCVHPEHRKQNHMRKLMAMAMEYMRGEGCHLSLLDGARQRYGYWGFGPAGEQISYYISAGNRRHALPAAPRKGIRFAPLTRQEVPAALALHDCQAIHADRTADDFLDVLASSYRIPSAIYLEDRFIGYISGIEDHSEVDELILADNSLLKDILAAWMDAYSCTKLKLNVPCHDLDMNRLLSGFAEGTSSQHSMRMAIFDYPRVISAFLGLKAQQFDLPNGTFELMAGEQSFTAAIRDGRASVVSGCSDGARSMSAPDVIAALFSPQSRFWDIEAPAGWLPLPFALGCADHF